MNLNEKTRRALLCFQKNELTESTVYTKLARIEKNPANQQILLRIADEELGHYEILRKLTNETPTAARWRILKYYLLARILGITFAIKLMEDGERSAKENYAAYKDHPELQQIARDEEAHEKVLIGMINEERLEYMGSVVLGLNDALVEFTGALAGFTLALSDSKLIALTGSITGIAAALSMASSEYLSTKSEGGEGKHPIKASVYTGIAYVFTVVALVAPFVFISNVLVALGTMLCIALLIIALFNYYYAVARSESFRKRFTEMAILSFSVAAVSFLIGFALREFVGVEV
ncbi:MAG: VIT1/CCC1 transporter family protein [Tannerellaceae bacterium]